MLRYFFSLILLLLVFVGYSQKTLYMPLEFKKAYANGTRSLDGNPGKNYWQNKSDYRISAEIIPGEWKVLAKQHITYFNNSPDTLQKLVIKTYANHYKKGSARANKVPVETLTEGILISNFKINTEVIRIEDPAIVNTKSTYFTIALPEYLLPKDTIQLSMDWEVLIPKTYVNRIGAYDDHSAFIGYWYPQIAVYDDIHGWDTNEYLASQEFYTDLNNFDIEIKAPSNYRIWATGTLKNPNIVFKGKALETYNQIVDSKNIHAINKYDESNSNEKPSLTWIFKADNVRDFSFGISNNFKWLGQTVKSENHSVISNVIYDSLFEKEAQINIKAQKASLKFLDSNMPGVPYPYNHFTTFIGVKDQFDGMEFSMMANNGISEKMAENVDVTFHELAHTYFPFLLGINEVRYSWMEEGWATYLTIKFIQDYLKGTTNENAEFKRIYNSYAKIAGDHQDVPLFSPSYYSIPNNSQSLLAYRKPAFLYLALEDLLGLELFRKCLKAYVKRWEYKHTMPYDFMFTFNDVSGLDLNWFWDAWIFNYGYMDLGIKEFNGSTLTIENNGRLPIPLRVQLNYSDGNSSLITKTPEVWKSSNKLEFSVEEKENLQSIQLLSDKFPDLDLSNNYLKID